jgi:hypothetical protein
MEQLRLDHLRAEYAKLLLENEKLTLELQKLQKAPPWTAHIKQFLPLVTALVAVGGFLLSLQAVANEAQKQREQIAEAAEAQRKQLADAEAARVREQQAADTAFRRSLRRETARPLWEKRLTLYLEAAEKAAIIATTDKGDPARIEAAKRFWILYWGPLAAIEDIDVADSSKEASIAKAMVKFGDALKEEEQPPKKLQDLSLALSRTIRDQLRPGFEVKDGGP